MYGVAGSVPGDRAITAEDGDAEPDAVERAGNTGEVDAGAEVGTGATAEAGIASVSSEK